MITRLEKEIREQAAKELAEEKFRLAVEVEKARLKRPWWLKVWPWKITFRIERR